MSRRHNGHGTRASTDRSMWCMIHSKYLWRSVAAMACDQPVSLTCVNVNSARHVAPTGAAPCYYTGVTQTTQATTEILSVNIRHRSKVVATVTAVFSSRPDVMSTLLWVLRKFCFIVANALGCLQCKEQLTGLISLLILHSYSLRPAKDKEIVGDCWRFNLT